ncbi:YdcF family protein [Palleronia abyssalis]|nr:YdcF family protein [Palleronia abyssalis]
MGAAVWTGGVPSPALRRRCAAAARLYLRGGIDSVVPSGGMGVHPPSEADVMTRLLIADGVPEADILPEDQARTTMETALLVTALVGPARITVVSDAYHLPRCWLAFRAHGHRVALFDADAAPRRKWRITARAWSREAVALPYYAVRILMGRIDR